MASNYYGFSNKHFDHIIQDVAEKLGLKSYNVISGKGAEKGSGFLGEIRRLTIEGTKDGNKSALNLIAKLVAPDEHKRESVCLEYFFAIEAYMYMTVLPELEKVQLNLSIDNKFKRPKCYALTDQRFKELIVMEDLNDKNYEKSRIEGITLDYEHTLIVLEEIARFHALSMVYKHRYPKTFRKITKWIPETNIFRSTQEVIFNGAVKYAMKNVVSDEFQELLTLYLKLQPYEKFRFQNNGNNYYNTAVITHGDLWTNNFLFKYKEGRPESVVLLDYQISKLASPVCDLYFFLFIAVCEQVRRERFQELLATYYEALCHQIGILGERPFELYPEMVFREDLKRFSFAGMTYAMYMLPIFTGQPEDIERSFETILDADDEFVLGSPEPSELYVRRIVQMAVDIKTHNLHELWSSDVYE